MYVHDRSIVFYGYLVVIVGYLLGFFLFSMFVEMVACAFPWNNGIVLDEKIKKSGSRNVT